MINLICINLWQLTYRCFTIQLSDSEAVSMLTINFHTNRCQILITRFYSLLDVLIILKLNSWNKQLSIHGFVSGSDTNWRNNQEIKQRNIKFFLLIDPYEWSWIVFRILPLNENPFFHEQLVISALNHEQDHEQVTTTLITSVNSITPLASPHEQIPPKEC